MPHLLAVSCKINKINKDIATGNHSGLHFIISKHSQLEALEYRRVLWLLVHIRIIAAMHARAFGYKVRHITIRRNMRWFQDSHLCLWCSLLSHPRLMRGRLQGFETFGCGDSHQQQASLTHHDLH